MKFFTNPNELMMNVAGLPGVRQVKEAAVPEGEKVEADVIYLQVTIRQAQPHALGIDVQENVQAGETLG